MSFFSYISGTLIGQLRDLKNEGSFVQNYAYVFSGNAFNVLLQVLLSPVIARLYSPDDYGIFAVYSSIVLTLSLFTSLTYSNAILVPADDKKVFNLVALSASFNIISLLLGLVVFLFLKQFIVDTLNVEAMAGWVYLIPVSAFLLTTNVLISSLIIYYGKVKEDTTSVVSSNIFNRIFNLLYGVLLQGNALGLLLGDFLTKILRFFLLLRHLSLKKLRLLKPSFSIKLQREIASEYARYPKYVFPSTLLNTVSGHLPIYFLTFYFNSAHVGYYSFAVTLLSIPVQLFGNASYSIFLRKASQVYAAAGMVQLKNITVKFYWNLFAVSLSIYLIVVLGGKVLFTFAFGDQWSMAGEFAIYLAIYHIFLLIFTPISALFHVLEKPRAILWCYSIIFLIRVVVLLLYSSSQPLLVIQVFSLVNAVCFMAVTWYLLARLGVSKRKHLGLTLLILIAFTILITMFRISAW